jgi:hypothetical protein
VAVAPAPAYVTAPPPDVTYFYNDLAPYGTWVQLDGYGWCWQPTAVVVTRDWRPYGHGGYWVYSDFGWYWQSTYSWGWAPFHYGRWYSHPRCGWVWTPDRVWGPAWVTWRTYGDTCGWAPLPPRAVFDVGLGWSYNGVSVGASFGFNLGSDAFLFVSFGDFHHRDLHRRCLPPARARTVYNQTTIINNYVVNNNRIEHRGIPFDRVSSATRGGVPRATVRDWSDRPDRMPTRASSVVYRPRLEAPARPARMEAQKLDAQNPVIRHAPRASARVERPADSSGGATASRRTTLETPKVSSRSSAARPESSRPTQSARSDRTPQSLNWSSDSRATPAAPQPATPTPSSGTPRAYTRLAETSPAPAPQVQTAPARPQPVTTVPPTVTAPRAPENWKQGNRAAPGYRSDSGLPALGNARAAERSASAVTPSANPHVYQPKSGRQAAELRPPSTPAGNASAPRPAREPRSDSSSRRDR